MKCKTRPFHRTVFPNLNQGYLPSSANDANLFLFCGMCLLILLHNVSGLKQISLYKKIAIKFHPSLKQLLGHILGFQITKIVRAL